MASIVASFKALTLDEMIEAYPQITALLAAAKDARRLQLESEIKALGFKPGEGKRPPSAAVKYRSLRDPSKTWAGRGAEPTWLKAEMAESGKSLDAFKAA
ncbi:H-NS family nucleoid-associated regulatory protein [Bradyrhizobium manausense]|uniref:H-NS family nucleoid-associated regulatory protein n=1 Tax=Bradyrhizobium manausense TaxID=989370 RepID=UPI001BAC2998|nr:H-NS family nucleoid-associated regulatory protein [Bradyrhizobium manausense]MBR0721800.1 H-NS histone family protein [Bradyrhizobium manausense]